MKQKLIFFATAIIFILSFSQILNNVFRTLQKTDLVDYSVYSGAVSKFLAGKNPYQFFYGHYPNKIPFNYPPSTLLLLLPLNWLPDKIGQILFTLLSLISFWLTLYLILKMVKIRISLPHFLILLSFFNQTFPVKFTLILGQINLIVLGTYFLGIYYYQISNFQFPISKKNKNSNLKLWILSLLLLSIASSLKPFPLLTLPLFLIKGDYLFVSGVLFLFFIFNLISSFSLFKYYLLTVIPNLYHNISEPIFYDQSLMAFFKRLTNDYLLSKWLALALFLILYFFIIKFSYKYLCGVSLILALTSISSVFSWQHHLVFAYPLLFLFYLKNFSQSFSKPIKFLLFLFLWLIFAFHFKSIDNPLLKNPFFASYQTLAVVFLTLMIVFKKNHFLR